MDTPTIQPKGFFSRPEGRVGLIPPILAGGALIYFWGKIVPFLVDAADNTLHLIVVMAVIAAILFVCFDKNWRAFAFYLYRSIMRKITGLFVEIDPIGILKTYKERLESKLHEMDEALSGIRDQVNQLTRRMTKNQSEYDQSFAKAEVAERNSDTRQLTLESRQVDRLGKLLERQKASAGRLQFVISVLSRYREVSSDTITDIGRDIEVKQQEREEARSYNKGMKAAFGILKGLPNERDLFDQSVELLERQYSAAIGEVEQFMDVTKDIISSANLDDAAATELMKKKLEEWRTKNSGMTLGKTSKAAIIDHATKQLPSASGVVLNTLTTNRQAAPVPAANQSADDDYTKLFFQQ